MAKLKKPIYYPNKAYTWEPDAKFVLTGLEFAALYGEIRSQIYAPLGTSIKQKLDAFTVLEGVVARAVQEGIMTLQPVEEEDKK